MRAGIRIEPDWNVKLRFAHDKKDCLEIRIEPDWNVKDDGHRTRPTRRTILE